MSTKDSDNQLVMAAFAVVDVENAAGYAYLFREAKKNPDMAAFLNSPDTTCLLYTSPSPRDRG